MTGADSIGRVKGIAMGAMALALLTALLSIARASENMRPVDSAARPRGTSDAPHEHLAAASDSGLRMAYMHAIQRAVMMHWLRPESAQPGLRCAVEIRQDSAGNVTELEIVEPCNADPATRESIVAAVRRAQPLPHEGFESVLAASVRFTFRYDD
jgi:colicin import membrane protein